MVTFCTQEQCEACPIRVVCHCLQVTEEQVAEAVQTLEIRTLKELRRATGAGDGCTCCHRDLKNLIEQNACAAVG